MNNNPNPVYYPQPEPPKGKNGAAVVSLIMGILALVFSCCSIGGFTGVIPLIFGVVALITAIVSKSKSSTGKMPGMAIAGLIMGILGIVSGLIGIVIGIVAIAAGGSAGVDFDDIMREVERSL
ncbi:MAG: hypothetical protein J5849_04580 [Clostridia bacterium]|nr:hypothetical protein [Clostridia bacterium]